MARETKEEKMARLAREQADMQAAKVADFPSRVMQALAEATRLGFNLGVNDNLQFVVRQNSKSFNFNTEWDEENELQVENLEWAVSVEASMRAAAARKEAVRSAALAKLTPEERKELGL